MKKNLSIVILLISLAISQSVFSQTYSFEKGKVPEGWKIDKGVLHIPLRNTNQAVDHFKSNGNRTQFSLSPHLPVFLKHVETEMVV